MQPDDWLAEERRRHGPISEQEWHAGYDLYLAAVLAARQAENDKPAAEN
jgi:hypothetical protein